jgi:type I restriction enzyme, S subunit
MMSSKRLASNNNQVPEGYKKTEVGVIPEDWNIQTVSDIAIVRGGKRLPKGISLNDIPNPYPYIRVADMYEGGINTNDIKYVPEHIAPLIKSYRIYSTDLFISVAGTLGIIGEVPETMNGANLTENADRITAISCNKKFLLYALISERIKNEIDSQRTIGAQPKLALRRIEDFKLAFPNSDEEQKAIAQTLSDVDALIAALDKLIAKKRNIKTATMQQLLTGKTRLPGFGEGKGYKKTEVGVIPEDWKICILSELSQIVTGQTPPTHNRSYYGDEYLFVSPADIGSQKYITNTFAKLSKLGFSISRKYPSKTILFTCIGSTIGKCAIVVTESTSNQQINAILPSNLVNHQYLYYQLINNAKKIKNRAATQAVPIINKTEFGSTFIVVCSDEEQKAIAQVLCDIDTEITALEKRRAKTQAIKQGMMQELLTGKTRLINN